MLPNTEPMLRDEFERWRRAMHTKHLVIMYDYFTYLTAECGVWDEKLQRTVYLPLWKI